MFRNVDEYRKHLEALSVEALLGEEVMNDLVQAEFDSKQRSLDKLSDVLDELEDSVRRIAAFKDDLESSDIELDKEYLEQLAQVEIEKRLAAFEAGAVADETPWRSKEGDHA
jgi:hypothetical protein